MRTRSPVFPKALIQGRHQKGFNDSQLLPVLSVCFKQSYRLEFIFSENDYFTNSCLSKEYEIDFSASTASGKKLNYHGPTIVACTGFAANTFTYLFSVFMHLLPLASSSIIWYQCRMRGKQAHRAMHWSHRFGLCLGWGRTYRIWDSNTSRADWAAWQPGTCQVGQLVRRPDGPPVKWWRREWNG